MGYRAILIRLTTFLGGIYFFLKFVLPERIGGSVSAADPSQLEGGFVFGQYHQQILDGVVLVSAMALGLGLINLLAVHGSRMAFRRKGWPFSAALLLGLFTMLFVISADWRGTSQISAKAEKIIVLRDFSLLIESDFKAGNKNVKPWTERNQALSGAVRQLLDDIEKEQKDLPAGEEGGADELGPRIVEARAALEGLELGGGVQPLFVPNRNLAQALGALSVVYRECLGAQYDRSITKHLYGLMNKGFFASLGAAMFALLGFYIAAAAYRAFRIKSAESALMMAAALLVMLGQIPFGIWLWDGFPDLRLWLMRIPNSAASRAVEMGASIAGLVMAFRMWFSIESESFK